MPNPKKMRYAVYRTDNTLLGRSKTLEAANRRMQSREAKMLARIQPSTRSFSGYAIQKVIRRKP